MKNVIIAQWKSTGVTEAFSSLKAFCDNHSSYKYFTMQYHLGRLGKDYESDELLLMKRKMLGRK